MADGEEPDKQELSLPPGSPSVSPTDEGVVLIVPDGSLDEPSTRKPRKVKVNSLKDVLAIVSRRLEEFMNAGTEVTAFESNEIFCKLVRVYVEVTRCKTDEQALGVTPFHLKSHRRLA